MTATYAKGTAILCLFLALLHSVTNAETLRVIYTGARIGRVELVNPCYTYWMDIGPGFVWEPWVFSSQFCGNVYAGTYRVRDYYTGEIYSTVVCPSPPTALTNRTYYFYMGQSSNTLNVTITNSGGTAMWGVTLWEGATTNFGNAVSVATAGGAVASGGSAGLAASGWGYGTWGGGSAPTSEWLTYYNSESEMKWRVNQQVVSRGTPMMGTDKPSARSWGQASGKPMTGAELVIQITKQAWVSVGPVMWGVLAFSFSMKIGMGVLRWMRAQEMKARKEAKLLPWQIHAQALEARWSEDDEKEYRRELRKEERRLEKHEERESKRREKLSWWDNKFNWKERKFERSEVVGLMEKSREHFEDDDYWEEKKDDDGIL